jgi:putative selenium metabolism protein SsnA
LEPILLTGGTIVTLGPDAAVLDGAALAVADGAIAEIGEERALARRYPGAPVVDAGGRVVMPGFVNAHCHVYSALARGIPPAGDPPFDFPEILARFWWRLDRALDAEMIRASADVAALDALRRGTTTLVDHHSSPSAIEGSLDLLADALEAAGVRASLCFEVSDRDGKARAAIAENLRFLTRCRERGGTTGALFGLHASFTIGERTLEICGALAGEHDVGCHIHLAEHPIDDARSLEMSGLRAAERLARSGVLGPKSVVAHGVTLDASQAALLAETKTALVTNPRSNAVNGVGATPVARLLAAGVPVGLGTDGYTYDALSEAAFFALAQRLSALSPRAADGLLPRILAEGSPEVALRACGVRAGILAPGCAADLILVEYDPPTPLDGASLWGHLAIGLPEARVTDVMVNGRWVMREGTMLTLDEARVRAKAREQARRLWAKFEEG